MKTRRRRRVLLAEDDDELRKLLTARLRTASYSVTACANGIELLDQLDGLLEHGRAPKADLIISDVRMPGLSGMDLLAGLQDLGSQIPIFLITAFGDDDLHARARCLGAAAVFDKPFDIDEIVAEMTTLLLGFPSPR